MKLPQDPIVLSWHAALAKKHTIVCTAVYTTSQQNKQTGESYLLVDSCQISRCQLVVQLKQLPLTDSLLLFSYLQLGDAVCHSLLKLKLLMLQ